MILCAGFASKKVYPEVKNRDRFKEISFHTADCPWEGVDIQNKKVVLIGTCASGVQVVQEIGYEVGELVVFHRTPNTAIPLRQKPGNKDEQLRRRDTYPDIFERLRSTSLSCFE